MGWPENKELQEKIKVGEYYDNGMKKDISVRLKKLVEVTENFSDDKRIGIGGFLGSVYKAEVSKAPKITVAVKKLYPRHKGKINGLIKKEIILMIKLDREDTVNKLLHVHIGEELQLLVYEYMENESLETALFKSKVETIPWEKRFGICVGVARGLEFLHSHPYKIVHGNIKPSNILLDRNYKPKLSNFRLASIYTDEDRFPVIRQETPRGYLKGDNPTFKTDIYSFGVLLIEIVAGKRNREFIALQETIDLVDMVHKHFKEQNRTCIWYLVDKRFADDLDHINEQLAEEVLRLGVMCTSQPSLRPEISEIVRVLDNANTKVQIKSGLKSSLTTGDGSGSSAY